MTKEQQLAELLDEALVIANEFASFLHEVTEDKDRAASVQDDIQSIEDRLISLKGESS